jgi:hypothetical protein
LQDRREGVAELEDEGGANELQVRVRIRTVCSEGRRGDTWAGLTAPR